MCSREGYGGGYLEVVVLVSRSFISSYGLFARVNRGLAHVELPTDQHLRSTLVTEGRVITAADGTSVNAGS